MTTIPGAIPPRLASLAELAGQDYDRNDRTAVRYREMLADALDPTGTAARKAAENLVKEKVATPTRSAMKKIGIIAN